MVKFCPRCTEIKSVDLFTKSASRKDGLQAYCSECMKAYRIEHYRSNKKQYYDRNEKTRQKIREIIWESKSGPCLDCGESYPSEPWVMDFDHREDHDKIMEVSKLASYGSVRKIKEEISKCDLLCVICHRRRTAERAGWTSSDSYGIIESL